MSSSNWITDQSVDVGTRDTAGCLKRDLASGSSLINHWYHEIGGDSDVCMIGGGFRRGSPEV